MSYDRHFERAGGGYDRFDEMVDAGFGLDVARSQMPAPERGEGELRVWWIRNVPRPATHYPVADLVEAVHLFARLVWHDLQNSKNVESNVGGLEVFHAETGWEEWFNDECDALFASEVEDFGQLFDAVMDGLSELGGGAQ